MNPSKKTQTLCELVALLFAAHFFTGCMATSESAKTAPGSPPDTALSGTASSNSASTVAVALPVQSPEVKADQARDNGTAKTMAIRGKAFYFEEGAWRQLKAGKVLKPGTVVKTEATSQVDLFLKQNGPVLRIVGYSQLAIVRLKFEEVGTETIILTELDLLSGRVLGNVKKMAAGSRYEIKTPKGLRRVRGTEYDVQANGRASVITGAMEAVDTDANGRESKFTVQAGQTFVPSTATDPARVIPTPPGETDPFDGVLGSVICAAVVAAPSIPGPFDLTKRSLPGSFGGQPLFSPGSRNIPSGEPSSAMPFPELARSMDAGAEEVWIIRRLASDSSPPEAETAGSGAMLARLSNKKRDMPLPLKHTAVQARISAYIATVEVSQQFHNPYAKKIEAVYVFPLPHNAAVNEFIMTIGQRRIRGIIRERQEAERVYQAAKRQGYVASLLTQERPNLFTQSVANLEPGKPIDVNIKYFHTLAYADGWYEFVFPMVVGPRFNPPGSTAGVGAVARGKGGISGQPTEVQYLKPRERSGHDISLKVEVEAGVTIEEAVCRSHVITRETPAPDRLRVGLSPNDRIPNKDFVLRYRVAGDRIKSNVLTHRDKRGGYFTLMIYPPQNRQGLARKPMELVFVLDCSGSMSGRPLAQAKAAVERALQQLLPDDTFQIIRFSNAAEQLAPEPLAATPDNVRQGLDYLTSLHSEGGTMMITGIQAALDFPQDARRRRLVSFLTDGYIGNEAQILAEVHRRLGSARIFSFGMGSSVNRYLLEHLAQIGHGAVAYVGLNDSAAQVMDDFVGRIAHPALADLKIDWDTLHVSDLFPVRLPDLLVGRPVILTGRFTGLNRATIRITGNTGDNLMEWRLPVNLNAPDQVHSNLPSVWARIKMAELGEQAACVADRDLPNQIKQLALDYGLMSNFTAFVAVDSTARTAGEGDLSVPVAVPLPEGVSYKTTVPEK